MAGEPARQCLTGGRARILRPRSSYAPAPARTSRQPSGAGRSRGRGPRPAPGPGREIVAFGGHRQPSFAALLTVHRPIPSAAGWGRATPGRPIQNRPICIQATEPSTWLQQANIRRCSDVGTTPIDPTS